MFEPKNLRGLVEENDLAFFFKDIEGRYLYINEAGAKMLGQAREAIIGRDDFELFEGASAKLMRSRDKQIWSSTQVSEYDSLAQVGSSWMLFHSVKYKVPALKTRPAGLLGLSANVTRLRSVLKQDILHIARVWMNRAPSRFADAFLDPALFPAAPPRLLQRD